MTEAQMEEGPMLNVNGQPEAAAQVEAPIPLHDEPAAETQEQSEPLERPDNFPAKFWTDEGPDIDKLAKSYTELEKQFKAGKHKAPEEYDISPLVDQGLDQDDPTMDIFKNWAKENGVSQAAFEELASKVLQASAQEQEAYEIDRQQEMGKLGERAQEKIEMAERLLVRAPLTNDEREAIAYSLNSADAINAFLKYHQSITNEGIPVAPAINTPSITREDLEAAIADPRWKTDAGFRSKIEKQWMQAQSA